MKNRYIVYLDGNEVSLISAANQNAAEKKAYKKYKINENDPMEALRIEVVYTEV